MNRRQYLKNITVLGLFPLLTGMPARLLSNCFVEAGDITLGFDASYSELIKTRNKNAYLADLSDLGVRKLLVPFRWEALFNEGVGRVNNSALAEYERLIDTCLTCGIEPWISLSNGVLPRGVNRFGGWNSRRTIDYFTEYASYCSRTFSDRVRYFTVINKPSEFTGYMFLQRKYNAGISSFKKLLQKIHYINLCQAEGGRAIKHFAKNAKVGMVQYAAQVVNDKKKSLTPYSAGIVDVFVNRICVEPLLNMGYPVSGHVFLSYIEKYFEPDDMKRLDFSFDFIGIEGNHMVEVTRYLGSPLLPAGLRDVSAGLNKPVSSALEHTVEKYWNHPNVQKLMLFDHSHAENQVKQTVSEIQLAYKQCIAFVSNARKRGIAIDDVFWG